MSAHVGDLDDVADVAIAGAGPAGAVAATLLARAGRPVVLIDPGLDLGCLGAPDPVPDPAPDPYPALPPHRNHEPSPKIGETLPAAADRLLRAHGLPVAAADPRHRSIVGTLTSWDGPPQLTDALLEPEGPPLRLDRRAFDRALVAAALAAGVRPVRGRLRRPRRNGEAWSAGIDGLDGPYKLDCRWLVDATGRVATLARALGARRESGPPLVAVWAVGRAGPGPGLGSGSVSAQVDRTLIERAPDGWWYGVWLPCGRPLAAFHTAPRQAARLKADADAWRARLAAAPLLADALGTDAFAGTELHGADATGRRLLTPVGSGWIAVGDAAVAFDPIASQGILNAVASGLAAAKALLADDPDAACAAYAARHAEVWRRYRLRRDALYARRATHAGSFPTQHLHPAVH